MNKVLIPLIRKHLPAIIAQDIVGVQPMGIVKHRHWRSYLDSLSSRYNQWLGQGYKDDRGLDDATELMQKHYPGNYTLFERYNTTRGVIDLDIKFENPKEEMLWKIKWE